MSQPVWLQRTIYVVLENGDIDIWVQEVIQNQNNVKMDLISRDLDACI